MQNPKVADVDSDDLLDMLRHVVARPPNAERVMLIDAILAVLKQRGIAFIAPGGTHARPTLH